MAANTYTLISSNVLASSAASVTFSSIPATYTDLVVKCSTRTDVAGAWNGALNYRFNGLSTTIYSWTILQGSGSAATTGRLASATYDLMNNNADTASNTSNTFTNDEIYIPNYAGSAQKPSSAFSASENNTTAAYIHTIANLVNLTSAITSFQVYPTAGNFDVGSSFYLYGIKNS